MAAARDVDREQASRRIAEVRNRFLNGLEDRLAGLSKLALKAGGWEPQAAAARDELRLGLHNLAGSAPTLGLDALGRRAAAIERQVIDHRRPDGGLDHEVAASVAAEIRTLTGSAGPL